MWLNSYNILFWFIFIKIANFWQGNLTAWSEILLVRDSPLLHEILTTPTGSLRPHSFLTAVWALLRLRAIDKEGWRKQSQCLTSSPNDAINELRQDLKSLKGSVCTPQSGKIDSMVSVGGYGAWSNLFNTLNLPMQCLLFTVPVVAVVRFWPHDMQDSWALEGWYVPRGHRRHVLFAVANEPLGQSAEKRRTV